MTFTDVLPDVQSLSRLDKIRLIQFLAQELEGEEVLPQLDSYLDLFTDDASVAAAVLLHALQHDGKETRVQKDVAMKQRNKMRELFRVHGENKNAIIEAYTKAEQSGDVQRQSNILDLTPSQYAARLLADGIKKRWINEPSETV